MARIRRAASVDFGTLMASPGVDHARTYSAVKYDGYQDALQPAPVPNPTRPVRESVFETRQRWHFQFHIDPTWGRRGHGGNRYPRFSYIGMIAAASKAPSRVPQEMVPQRRYTRVLRYPRAAAVPGTYGVQ